MDKIIFDLDKFRVNLLAIIYLFKDSISVVIFLCKDFYLVKLNKCHRQLILELQEILLLISLIYTKKSNGPNTEPWGAAQLIFLMMIADFLSLHIEIYWREKKKIDLKQHHKNHNCQIYSVVLVFYDSLCQRLF